MYRVKIGFWMVLLLGMGRLLQAQPLHPEVAPERPTPHVVHPMQALQRLPAAIALVYPSATAGRAGEPYLQETVRQWEYLLTGLGLPYQVIYDEELPGALEEHFRVVILPHTEVLSDRGRKTLRRFLARGGGLIASGETAYYDHRGRLHEAFFREVFGAELITLPDTLPYLYHHLPSGHPLTDGLIPGFRLNLEMPRTPSAARVVAPERVHALGRPIPYTEGFDPTWPDRTFLLYGTYEDGRFFWLRFDPQQVSTEERQQRQYQALVINGLAYVAGLMQMTILPWPDGYRAAMTPVITPVPDASPLTRLVGTEHMVRLLKEAQVPSTWFLTQEDVPTLAALDLGSGLFEVATAGNTRDRFEGLDLDIQRNRLAQARSWLERATGQQPLGFWPPAEMYDIYTVWAMQDAGLKYLFTSTHRLQSAPVPLNWLDEADWRLPILPSRRLATVFHVARNGVDDYTLLQVKGLAGKPEAQLAAYRADMTRALEEGGLYTPVFHPEIQTLLERHRKVFGDLLAEARQRSVWLTTLRQAVEWMERRDDLVLDLRAREGYLEVAVENRGQLPVSGVALLWRTEGGRPEVYPQVGVERRPEGWLLRLPPLEPGRFLLRVRQR